MRLIYTSKLKYSNHSEFPGISDAYLAFAAALPWLDLFPIALNQVIPIQMRERLGLRNQDGCFLPFSQGFSLTWNLLAISGNLPIDVFGE